ncbi:MAG: 4-hydroxy-3-methylbut-2-enyl diphosphate reductase [Acidaminococcaceae bacterium]|nr:4-hydroxy-3-methylbut-2-enyl diphosphate reductase [Acidaminococcaceae bacterium]
MKIIVADPCGFCYGVKRAVAMAEGATDSLPAATLGQLVHNAQVTDELAARGVGCKDSLDQFSEGETVIFRSHGVGPDVYEKAIEKKLKILDATCPNVKMSQNKARQAFEDGYLPIIVGEKNHPEVKSILAFAGNNAIILERKEDIGEVPFVSKYCVIIQTTFELAKFEEILQALQAARPGEYRVERTICLATKERQNAAAKLAAETDAFIVIGGRNSANTRHLTELVSAICPRCYQIETAKELSPEMFTGCRKIGITAGASTPERIIKEAVIAMENMEINKVEGNEFEAMLDASMEDYGVHPGKLVTGKVIQVDKEGVYISFGYRREGLIAWNDWAVDANPDEMVGTVNVGDEVEAVVVPGSTSEEFIRLSKIRAEKEAAWKNVQELPEGERRLATVKVLRVIKARGRDKDKDIDKPKQVVGLAVAVEGVEGFMPASHVELRHIDDFTPYVGQELEAEIIEVNPEKKRIVVSRRDLLKAEKAQKHQEWLANREARIAAAREARAAREAAAYEEIVEGETYEGKVVKVADFGLFVEVIDGLVGLVHNTELSYDRSLKAEDVAKEGDMVKVFVKKVDKENRRVSLSIKATQEDPWIAAAAGFNVGDVVEGTVERFLPFGALVRLNDRVEGMIHVSELADTRVEKPEDVLKIGQVVTPMIIKIDQAKRKVGLSLIRAKKDEEKAEMKAFMAGNAEENLSNNAMAEQLEGINK